MLDAAFEAEGFCVVRGPDVLWGGDIRRFHPPAGKFGGVIGGPPCQTFSALASLVRHNGYQPRFGNLIPEFERCVAASAPNWFVMENVPKAPVPTVEGYRSHSFLLNNRSLGEKQNRVRRWTFGSKGKCRLLDIDKHKQPEHPEWEYACAAGGGVTQKKGAPAHRKMGSRTLTSRCDTKAFRLYRELQGLPDEFDLPPFTVMAKCQAIANGVPMAMGRAIAKAVKEATDAT